MAQILVKCEIVLNMECLSIPRWISYRVFKQTEWNMFHSYIQSHFSMLRVSFDEKKGEDVPFHKIMEGVTIFTERKRINAFRTLYDTVTSWSSFGEYDIWHEIAIQAGYFSLKQMLDLISQRPKYDILGDEMARLTLDFDSMMERWKVVSVTDMAIIEEWNETDKLFIEVSRDIDKLVHDWCHASETGRMRNVNPFMSRLDDIKKRVANLHTVHQWFVEHSSGDGNA